MNYTMSISSAQLHITQTEITPKNKTKPKLFYYLSPTGGEQIILRPYFLSSIAHNQTEITRKKKRKNIELVKNRNTDQEANRALFEVVAALGFVTGVARGELGVEYELLELLVVHVLVLVQPLRPRVLLVHHLPLPP